MAGRWGFEPQIETSPITDFESAAFDHSAIFPYSLSICYPKLQTQLQQMLSAHAVKAAFAFSHLRFDAESAAYHNTLPSSLIHSQSVALQQIFPFIHEILEKINPKAIFFCYFYFFWIMIPKKKGEKNASGKSCFLYKTP